MKKLIRFGMVQGRLSKPPGDELQWFPQDSWQKEFSIASEIGVDYIELIAETQHNPDNPIWSDQGVEEITQLVEKNLLTLYTLCNDYIIEHTLRDINVAQQNIDLLKQAEKLSIEKYILPMFEHSELSMDNMEEYVEPIRLVAESAHDKGIVTCLETILTGKELTKVLDVIDRPYVKVVYDTGNRVAFGHDLASDIRLLGDKIAHVHIKDKDKNNTNVLLGTGLVNFAEVFYALRDIHYLGPFTFETTRGANPLNTARYNLNLVEFFKENSESNA